MNYNFEKPFTRVWFKNYFLILQGSVIQSIGYTLFLVPNKIVPGGLYGVATILYHRYHLPVGTMVFVMNIPLIIWGIRVLGPRFGAKTIVGIVLTSFSTDLIIYAIGIPELSGDLLVQSIIGGILVGYGVALIFKTMATTGGVEIAAQIFNSWYKISVGKSILFMNSAVILAGVVLFRDLNMAIYSAVSVYAISKVMDVSLEGMSYYKGILILSERYDDIKDKIRTDMQRGFLLLDGKGLFDDRERRIIISALTRRELAFLKEYLKSLDEDIFFVVFNAHEIVGKGYQRF